MSERKIQMPHMQQILIPMSAVENQLLIRRIHSMA